MNLGYLSILIPVLLVVIPLFNLHTLFLSFVRSPSFSMVNPWFIVESIHFFLGSLGCCFFPDTVISSYAINRVPITLQAEEMTEVLASYYVSFMSMAIVSIWEDEFAHWFSLGLFIFYANCMIWDLRRILAMGITKYPGYRWLDTSIHVIMFAGNLIYFLRVES